MTKKKQLRRPPDRRKTSPQKATEATPKKAVRSAKTQKWQDAFIAELSKGGNVSSAAAKAGVGRQFPYKVAKEDLEFKARWEEAIETACDTLEAEAWRRAVQGTKKPVFQGKELVGHIQEYSDTLLIVLLKAHRPQKFRERSGSVANFDPTKLTNEQLQRIVAGEDPIQVLATS